MKTTFVWKSHTLELPALPESFVAEVSALSPRLQYLVSNGWNQSILDSYAGAEDEADFRGRATKKMDAILSGTVKTARGGGGGRTSDPVEREFKRLVNAKVAEWHRERKNAKKPKASAELEAIWLERFMQLHGEELRAQASVNVEAARAIDTSGLDDLLEGLE